MGRACLPVDPVRVVRERGRVIDEDSDGAAIDAQDARDDRPGRIHETNIDLVGEVSIETEDHLVRNRGELTPRRWNDLHRDRCRVRARWCRREGKHHGGEDDDQGEPSGRSGVRLHQPDDREVRPALERKSGKSSGV